jgi:hypothetical protein
MLLLSSYTLKLSSAHLNKIKIQSVRTKIDHITFGQSLLISVVVFGGNKTMRAPFLVAMQEAYLFL